MTELLHDPRKNTSVIVNKSKRNLLCVILFLALSLNDKDIPNVPTSPSDLNWLTFRYCSIGTVGISGRLLVAGLVCLEIGMWNI